MATKTVKAVTTVVAAKAVTLAATAPVTYTFGKVPRSGLHQATKHGQGGTAGTYAAVAAALATGPKTMAELKAITTANGDAGFAKYAARMLWVVPVSA